MPKNKKKFIDKKNAVTFHLVHRSQRDPLAVDETAPQRVLQPADKDNRVKYGIYFDDDYDYMQHLKVIEGKGELVAVDTPATSCKKGTKKLELPSSVFTSEVEEKVAVLNRAPQTGFQPNLDPEVVDVLTAMDDDFDFSDPENNIEDDFVALAQGLSKGGEEDGSGEEYDEEYDDEDDENYSDEERDEVNSIDMAETKTRFTEYSITSSVMRRNEHLSMLDDRFESMFAEYDDNEIGALECEEIEGAIDDETALMRLVIKDDVKYENDSDPVKPAMLAAFSCSSDSEDSIIDVPEKPKWDCESILSTYSTLYNHPAMIDAPPSKIKLNRKTGIPMTSTRLTASALSKLEGAGPKATGPGSLVSQVSMLSIRSKNESPAERRDRKDAFKKYKKERRLEKKLNTIAFKEEKKRMEKMMTNNKSKFIQL